MQPIKMIDLHSQYLHIKKEIDQSIQEVIGSSVFIKGDRVAAFEEKLSAYLHAHVVSCANGTDALQLAFMALRLKPGDEVITTPFTFVSTVEVLVLLGLKPVFVDINPNTYNINEEAIEKIITNKTKAILPVHLFGQCANMETIMALANKYQLYVVEDVAQSLGANYQWADGIKKQAGTMGHIGTTSFFPSKNLGAFGDGGAVICTNPVLAEKIRSLANHGMIQKYDYQYIGINSRLDALQAAILEVKLQHLDTYLLKRQQAAGFYHKNLKGIDGLTLPETCPTSTHTYNQYTIKAEKRDELKNYLSANHIPSQVYYPRPLHLQKAYEHLGYKKNDFPVSETLSAKVLSLPMHTELEEGQLQYIVDIIKRFYTK